MIAEAYHDLLEAATTAVLTTVMPDGSPQGSPVWFWFDGEAVVVSTTADRLKYRNVVREPRVAFTVFDPAAPLRYLEVRGRAVLEEDPPGEMRDRIARKHGFADGTAFDAPGARRVNIRITPGRVIEH